MSNDANIHTRKALNPAARGPRPGPGGVISAVLFVGALLTVSVVPQARAANQGPFSGMAGLWSGDGTVTMADGTHERVRCRVTYAVPPAGESLDQGLRCASDSYQFDVTSHVQASQDGVLAGTWSEAIHGVTGDVTGRVLATGSIDTSVETFGFSARLLVSTQGKRQHLSILPQGNDVQSVTVDMQRI